MTEWRDVPGFGGNYLVSRCGAVKRRGSELPKVQTLSRGYMVVSLWSENKGRTMPVHRLVAMAFVPGDHSLSVDHIDGNKVNNHASNLEWVTLTENTLRQHSLGLASAVSQYKPTKVPASKHSVIQARVKAGERQKDLASEYGCSQPLISWICKQSRHANYQHCQQVMK
jgi:hypothetical protein